ncbi:alpha-glucosidase-like [Anopheles funestus]|uniref:alpha-glucosidase-like n=1 Tax=Anopheles funestus TaxID=62324 RepID=UPI0020C6B58F|nr:alpha-glucosidase-like [Anopheles funestus]
MRASITNLTAPSIYQCQCNYRTVRYDTKHGMKFYRPLLVTFALVVVLLCGFSQAADDKDWYQHATFYQIYPRSFQDSNGDGIGDLKGITSRMEYLAGLGIDATWLSPPFVSPLADFGYDVADFYDIQPEYGTLADMEELIAEAHRHGIKLMLDFIPNHSSDEHDWFVQSATGNAKYRDYYIWRPGKVNSVTGELEPPNNWISVFGGPAWTYDTRRGEFYLHQFTKKQADLNYRNPTVVQEMTDMLTFWLEKGVDGFRLDAINHMFEDPQLRDEPPGWGPPGSYDELDHIYTKDNPDTYGVVYNWRELCEDYGRRFNKTIIIMTEAYASIENTMLYYEDATGTRQGAHMPFNFQLIYDFKNDQNAIGLKQSIDFWMNHMPARHTPSWVAGSHDHSRVASRVGLVHVDQVLTLVHTLPGTSITYYGEEIGMFDFKEAETYDNRDPNRTPMQWDNTISAGFSTNRTTWLRLHPDYPTRNVMLQEAAEKSTLKHFRTLTALRRHPSLVHGEFVHRTVGADVYAFSRELHGEDTLVTVLNMAASNRTVDLGDFVNLPHRVKVEIAQPDSNYKAGDEIDIHTVTLLKHDSVVLRAIASGSTGIKLSMIVMLLAAVKHLL